MKMSARTVHDWISAYAGIAIDESREAELLAELKHFRSIAQAARNRVQADVDPFEFRAALVESSSKEAE